MIRRSSPEDAETLTTIALEAKRHWGYPEHWIKHWESDLTISSGFIRENHVYVAEENGDDAQADCGGLNLGKHEDPFRKVVAAQHGRSTVLGR